MVMGREAGELFDAIVVGAGPGGLQAAIHLARFNRRVVLFDGGPGRTRHAVEIENYLGLRAVGGSDLIATGIAQAASFGVRVERASVARAAGAAGGFEAEAGGAVFRGRFLVAASGGAERYPQLGNLGRHFGRAYVTCIVCDGYRATGRKLLVSSPSLEGVRLAIAAKKLFTRDVSFLAEGFAFPGDHRFLLAEEGIALFEGEPAELLGEERLEGLRLRDGRIIPCEMVLGGHGYRLNDGFLAGFPLEREGEAGKIRAGTAGESSVPGLFVVGALRAGPSQVAVSVGQGALAALEIARRLVGL